MLNQDQILITSLWIKSLKSWMPR